MISQWVVLAQQDPGSWIAWIEDAGVKAALVVVIWLLVTRRIITRGTYDEAVQDRDRWRDAYLELKRVTESAVDAVKEKG